MRTVGSSTSAQGLHAEDKRQSQTLHPDSLAGAGLSFIRQPKGTSAQLDTSLQLASPSWPKLKDTNQSPWSQPGQPVEAPQLERDGFVQRKMTPMIVELCV